MWLSEGLVLRQLQSEVSSPEVSLQGIWATVLRVARPLGSGYIGLRVSGMARCSPARDGRCSRSSTDACFKQMFTWPGGHELRTRIDDTQNPEYQRLLRCTARRAARTAARRQRCDRWSGLIT
jgi:hypothetical protein